MEGISVVGVVAFEERGDGVTVYHVKLSNDEILKRRYNDLRKMFERLPEHEKKRLRMVFPGKTGLRKANSDEKNKRLAAFDRLMKQISAEPALSSSPAFKAFLSGEKAAKPGKAGKDAKKGAAKVAKGLKKMTRKEFKETEIDSFDDFFGKCQEPLDTINDLSEKVADSHDVIHECFHESFVVSAGVVEGDFKALFAYFFSEIKKVDGGDVKFKVNDDFEPKLKFKGKHAKHVIKFLEAIETLVTAIVEFVTTCPDLVDQIAEFAQEAADFPNKVRDEAPGMNPMKIPGAIKKTADNVKYLGGVPNEFKEVFDNIKQFMQLLQTCCEETFGVAAPGDL